MSHSKIDAVSIISFINMLLCIPVVFSTWFLVYKQKTIRNLPPNEIRSFLKGVAVIFTIYALAEMRWLGYYVHLEVDLHHEVFWLLWKTALIITIQFYLFKMIKFGYNSNDEE